MSAQTKGAAAAGSRVQTRLMNTDGSFGGDLPWTGSWPWAVCAWSCSSKCPVCFGSARVQTGRKQSPTWRTQISPSRYVLCIVKHIYTLPCGREAPQHLLWLSTCQELLQPTCSPLADWGCRPWRCLCSSPASPSRRTPPATSHKREAESFTATRARGADLLCVR